MKFEWLPLEVTPQWAPATGWWRSDLGYRWRLHYRWDCAAPDPGFSKWKRTFGAGYAGHAKVFTPMGNLHTAHSAGRRRALRRRTGFKSASELLSQLNKARGAFEFDVGRRPPAVFARYMTNKTKVDIAAWVDYRHYDWIVDRGPGKPLLSVVTVSVPFRLTLHAFVTGFCLETPPALPKGAVAQFSYPPLVSADPKVARKRTGVLATRTKVKASYMPPPFTVDPFSGLTELTLFSPDRYTPP